MVRWGGRWRGKTEYHQTLAYALSSPLVLPKLISTVSAKPPIRDHHTLVLYPYTRRVELSKPSRDTSPCFSALTECAARRECVPGKMHAVTKMRLKRDYGTIVRIRCVCSGLLCVC